MTKPFVAIVFSIVFISCQQNKSDTTGDKERIDHVCETFMDDFTKGQYNAAMDLLRQYSVLGKEKIDTLAVTIKNQMSLLIPAYGKILSSSFIIERRVKDFISKRFYILKFEKYYLRFDFTLYKTNNGWTITGFSYDDNLVELLY
ncbi:MAG TPA: hypothetical protein VFP87_13290 [Chitinophagaceae bacterium]|nr:hypothetical protein [Chitinophagaceae bacterium]